MSTNLTPSDMLRIWERGEGWHPLDQALLVLQATDPGFKSEAVAEWPLGRRDRRLIEIRQAIFGDGLSGYADCPNCGSGMEFELSCRQLMEQNVENFPGAQQIGHDGKKWELRPPNSRDLSKAMSAPDITSARRVLWGCCVCPIDELNTTDVNMTNWSDDSVLIDKLAQLDPLAEVLLDLTCQTCGRSWQSLFDIAIFLWSEIRTSSRRLLQDIDVLARMYGWNEDEILRLSDSRRKLYVEMALS